MKRKSIFVNLVAIALLSVAMLWGVTLWIGSYTRHGEIVIVPDTRGRTLGEVAAELDALELKYEIVDSLYDKAAVPGTIRKTTPQPGARVKPGRILFVSVYAMSPRKLVLPLVENVSKRQAIAQMQAMGFEHVELRTVQGEYNDLCLGVEDAMGNRLLAGTMISKDARLVLLISGQVRDSLNVGILIDSLSGGYEPDNYGTASGGTTIPTTRTTAEPEEPTEDPNSWW